MRKVRYFVANSLDGFISRTDGGVDWLFMDQDYGMAEFFASVDVAIMGRKTYDKMQELAPDQMFSPGITSYVLSRTRGGERDSPFTFINEPLVPWIEDLRQQPGKDIWLVGGGELFDQAVAAIWHHDCLLEPDRSQKRLPNTNQRVLSRSRIAFLTAFSQLVYAADSETTRLTLFDPPQPDRIDGGKGEYILVGRRTSGSLLSDEDAGDLCREGERRAHDGQ